MTESNALVSIEQREVAFYDDLLTAVRSNDGQCMLPFVRFACLWGRIPKPNGGGWIDIPFYPMA